MTKQELKKSLEVTRLNVIIRMLFFYSLALSSLVLIALAIFYPDPPLMLGLFLLLMVMLSIPYTPSLIMRAQVFNHQEELVRAELDVTAVKSGRRVRVSAPVQGEKGKIETFVSNQILFPFALKKGRAYHATVATLAQGNQIVVLTITDEKGVSWPKHSR